MDDFDVKEKKQIFASTFAKNPERDNFLIFVIKLVIINISKHRE